MAENKITVLDANFLKAFIRDEITEFKSGLEKILKDAPEGPSVAGLEDGGTEATSRVNATKPLVLGAMAGDGVSLGAGELNKAVASAAEKIKELLESHLVLFGEIEDALEETVTELTKSQTTSLDKITADAFMDIFEDIEDDFGGSQGNDDDDDDDT